MNRQYDDFAGFITNVRAAVIEQSPSRQDYFDIFANEANFGLSIIKNDLKKLPPGAFILEIGAGLFLLSGYLSTKGFRIHALEPFSAGFSHFQEMQNIITRHYEKNGILLNKIESTIENYSYPGYFDYIFSINAIEHIQDVVTGLSNAYSSLRHRGTLRIYCPNYHFPYEPHFNIPTLFSKQLTGFFFKSSIMNSSRVIEARETWDALNWINVSQVRRLFIKSFGVYPVFNKLAAYQIIERMLNDAQFSKRRSLWIKTILEGLDKVGALQTFKFIPVIISPVMDFYVEQLNILSEVINVNRLSASDSIPIGNGSGK